MRPAALVGLSALLVTSACRHEAPPARHALDQRLAGGGFQAPLAPPPPVPAPHLAAPPARLAAVGPGPHAAWPFVAPNAPTPPTLPFPVLTPDQALAWALGVAARAGVPLPPLAVPAPGARAGAVPAGACRVATVAGVAIPVDCAASFMPIPWAQRPVVERARLRDADAPLPEAADLSLGKLVSVRSQGPVGACTAASLSAALDYAMHPALATAAPVAPSSALHLWSRYRRPSMEQAALGNRERGVTPEAAWPWSAQRACEISDECGSGCGVREGWTCRPLTSEERRRSESATLGTLDAVTTVRHEGRELRAALAAGKPVWFAMQVGESFDHVRGPGAMVPDVDYRAENSGHAMVLVGYRTRRGTTEYRLQNSWGEHWGDRGFAWITEPTLLRNLRSAYLVDASLAAAPEPPPPVVPACPGDLLPDARTGQCVPACSDGSPRTAGVCPVASHCPPGYANLFGFCLPGPNPGAGADPTGVAFRCGSAGCAYVVPGHLASCGLPLCMVSCPAPRHVLTRGAEGLACSA